MGKERKCVENINFSIFSISLILFSRKMEAFLIFCKKFLYHLSLKRVANNLMEKIIYLKELFVLVKKEKTLVQETVVVQWLMPMESKLELSALVLDVLRLAIQEFMLEF